MTAPGRAAVVVAGGYSRRFGDAEKALATVDGVPLLRRVVERVAASVDTVVVNCRRKQRSAFEATLERAELDTDWRFVHDRVPDTGPVSGMASGLRDADASSVLVLSCDLPFLERAVVEALFEIAEAEERTAVPVADGHPQPLCAVYRRRPALVACRAALADGDGRARGVLQRLDLVRVDAAPPRSFRDVDTPDGLERARETAD